MKEMYKNVLERLSVKKNELKERQESFSVMCHNEMQSGCFERNAISDLVIMQQLKSEITELEHWETLMRVRLKKAAQKTIRYTLFGEEKTLVEWCKYAEIKYSRAYQRYRNGNNPFDKSELKKIELKLEKGS